MLYSEYISKAKNICILINETNNMAYLSPDYRYILYLAGMDLKDVTDFPDVTMDIVGENLKLEVEAYNKKNENIRSFVENLETFIASVVIPLQTLDQNEIIEMLLTKAKDLIRDNSTQVQQKTEKSFESSDDIIQMKNYINFQKKNV